MKKYQIIGGQYESHWYGESDSLHGAKCIAAKCEEYWDNWQGWRRPAIYAAENVTEIESVGRITSRDGQVIRVPSGPPAYVYDYESKTWNKFE